MSTANDRHRITSTEHGATVQTYLDHNTASVLLVTDGYELIGPHRLSFQRSGASINLPMSTADLTALSDLCAYAAQELRNLEGL